MPNNQKKIIKNYNFLIVATAASNQQRVIVVTVEFYGNNELY